MLRSESCSGVSIIIPTLNGGTVFKECLAMIARQDYIGMKELIILDSGSTDGTLEAAVQAGASVQKIAPETFHHSRTRNEGVKLAQYPNVVLLVQDAVPVGSDWLTNLVRALEKEANIVAAYGLPLPQPHADLFARYEVEQYGEYLGNKPIVQKISSKDLNDITERQLLRLARIHNVCAAYKKEFLEANPFPEVVYAEDLAWGLAAVKKGYGINYNPEIKVYHSHNRPPVYRFKRALVETLVCSEIFGGAKIRIPFLTVSEINEVLAITDAIIEKIKNNLKTNQVTVDFHFFSNLTYVKGNVISRIKQYMLTYVIHRKISGILKDILPRYPFISAEEKITVVDQIGAGLKGRLLGSAYLKYKMRNRQIPEALSEMVLPNLTGV